MTSGEETKYAIAMDIGGTNIRVALVSLNGDVINSLQVGTRPERGFDSVFADMIELLNGLIVKAHGSRVIGIGIASPGPLDPKEGVIIQTNNLGWKNIRLKELVEKKVQLRTYVDNDANLHALGERWLGVARGVDDLICLTLGTGVGGALIINGKIYHGANGAAGHIGHYIIDPNGRKCSCGGRGHLEAYASSTAIVQRTIEAIRAGRESIIPELVGNDLGKLTSLLVYKAAESSDELAVEIFQDTGFYIGIVLVSLINILNPKLIIIGGQVAKAGEILFNSIRLNVDRAISLVYPPPIVSAELGNDAGLLGAACLVLLKEGYLQSS